MITDSNMIMCEKCGQPALTNYSGVWMCGECMIKVIDKLKEKNRKMVLEE